MDTTEKNRVVKSKDAFDKKEVIIMSKKRSLKMLLVIIMAVATISEGLTLTWGNDLVMEKKLSLMLEKKQYRFLKNYSVVEFLKKTQSKLMFLWQLLHTTTIGDAGIKVSPITLI